MLENLLYIDEISIDECLKNIGDRFQRRKIYTGLGSVLLSVNPYQYFTGDDDLYDSNKIIDGVHLFATMDKVLDGLREKRNQVIIVSGESGSGKTETTKQIIKYLQKYSSGSIHTQIQAAGAILELFGNAPTEKNHNSSRFGKYIQVFFHKTTLECLGIHIDTYLLEKIRVLCQDIGQFHIFNDPGKCESLFIQSGFSREQADFVLTILGQISQIRNTNFEDCPYDFLKKRTMNIQGETIEKVYTLDEFIELRNSLAINLYEGLFHWILKSLNNLYNVQKDNAVSIGILDIFGFEDLKENSLEQLCINYTNEKVQCLLNNKLVGEKISLYKSEEIPIEEADFKYNTDQIECIEKLFIALDEECMLPKGNDRSLIQKLNLKFADSPFYKTEKLTLESLFSIIHYAGKIDYKIDNFCKKNMERLNPEIQKYIGTQFNIHQKKSATGKVRLNSITNQFRNELSKFFDSIHGCDVHFIKCIKPNNNETSMLFVDDIVSEQLRYNGVLELIAILRQGYSHNYDRDDFYKIYGCILKDDDHITLGKKRVFLKENVYLELQQRLKHFIGEKIIQIQANIRRKLELNRYYHKKQSILFLENILLTKFIQRDYAFHRSAYIIQRFFHRIVTDNKRRRRLAIDRIQNMYKCHLAKRKLLKRRAAVYKIIAFIKGYFERKHYRKIRIVTIKIQKWWRVILKKRHNLIQYNQYLESTISERDKKILTLERRIIELEQRLSRASFIDLNIIHERDHYIVLLKKDIESYQVNIEERLKEKVSLIEKIDKLTIENKILIRQLGYLRNQAQSSWLNRLFGL